VCEDLAERLQKIGWSVSTSSSKCNRLLRLAEMASAVVRKRNHYDVAQVDLYSGPAFLWAETSVRLLRLLRKPVVVTLHGGGLPEFARRHPKRVGSLLRMASCITSPSKFLGEELGFLGLKVHLIANAIDVSAYRYTQRIHAGPRFVWLRAIHSIYNPRLAVQVVAGIQRSHPGASLLFFGGNKDNQEHLALTNEIHDLGLNNMVRMMGKIEKRGVPEALNLGDVFLNTTNVDNTPVSVVEAMACGLCVVSTNVGGMPHLVRHRHNGLLVNPRSCAEMEGAVREILTDDDLASALSKNGRRTAEGMDWSVILPEWDSLLLRLSHARQSSAGINGAS